MRYFRTHYDNLKVSQDAPTEVIKVAYKALANKYHPDRNPNCDKSLRAMQAINSSYEVLIDPEKRRQHDAWISRQEDKLKAESRQRTESASPPQNPSPNPEKPPEKQPTSKPPPQKDSEGSSQTGCGCMAAIVVISIIVIAWISSQETPTAPRPKSYAAPSSTPTIRPDIQPTPSPFNVPVVNRPKNGELVVKANYSLVAPFEIRSQEGDDYYVKLTDVKTGEDAMTVFVRGGQTVETRAPLGRFIIKYASGTQWYGYEHLFGPDTIYSKAEEVFDFKRTISSSAQSRLFNLQRQLSIADANFRVFLTSKGMTEKQASFIFDGTNSNTGESGVNRLPPDYWKNLLGRINDPSLHNEIVDRLNSRNNISNQIIQIRNSEERIEGFTITLYKVRDGNLKTSLIDADEF